MSLASTNFDPVNVPPTTLFIEITHECNLHCKMCHLWNTKEDKARSLDTDEKIETIRQFKEINPNGAVVLTGGETMRKMDEFLSLSQVCNDLGLTSSANTNGTQITRPIIKKLVQNGPKYLVVSIDSIHRNVHDHMRGVEGTFDLAVNAIKIFSEEKRLDNCSITGIYTNCIVMEQNYRELEDYVAFVKGLGANGVMFQMLSRTFGLTSSKDYAFDTYLPKDNAGFKSNIAEFMRNHANDEFVKTSKASFNYMIAYVDNPNFLSSDVCASGQNNVMIDCYGNTQLCFNMHSLTGKFLGSVREKSLLDMWTSVDAENARKKMLQCRKSCGMLNCHRRN